MKKLSELKCELCSWSGDECKNKWFCQNTLKEWARKWVKELTSQQYKAKLDRTICNLEQIKRWIEENILEESEL